MVEDRGPLATTGGERAVELSNHEGRHSEDRLVEKSHRGADLVERLGPRYPDRVGSPERRDLFEEVPPEVLDLGGARGAGRPSLPGGEGWAQRALPTRAGQAPVGGAGGPGGSPT